MPAPFQGNGKSSGGSGSRKTQKERKTESEKEGGGRRDAMSMVQLFNYSGGNFSTFRRQVSGVISKEKSSVMRGPFHWRYGSLSSVHLVLLKAQTITEND